MIEEKTETKKNSQRNLFDKLGRNLAKEKNIIEGNGKTLAKVRNHLETESSIAYVYGHCVCVCVSHNL